MDLQVAYEKLHKLIENESNRDESDLNLRELQDIRTALVEMQIAGQHE